MCEEACTVAVIYFLQQQNTFDEPVYTYKATGYGHHGNSFIYCNMCPITFLFKYTFLFKRYQHDFLCAMKGIISLPAQHSYGRSWVPSSCAGQMSSQCLCRNL